MAPMTGMGSLVRVPLPPPEGREVLEDDLQLRKVGAQRDQLLLDETGFAVEHVDLGVGHFAVHQQRQPAALQRLERRVDPPQVGDPGIAVGGRAGRIELCRRPGAARWGWPPR